MTRLRHRCVHTESRKQTRVGVTLKCTSTLWHNSNSVPHKKLPTAHLPMFEAGLCCGALFSAVVGAVDAIVLEFPDSLIHRHVFRRERAPDHPANHGAVELDHGANCWFGLDVASCHRCDELSLAPPLFCKICVKCGKHHQLHWVHWPRPMCHRPLDQNVMEEGRNFGDQQWLQRLSQRL